MKKTNDRDLLISRRSFLRKTACAGLGITGMVNTLAHLTLVNNALAQSSLSGYRALVLVFLFGGNDSNNMLIPRIGHPSYNAYKTHRGVLRILDVNDPDRPSGAPASIALSTPDGNYGVHPNLQPMATMFDADELAFVANVGTLVHPILTQDDFINGTVPQPAQLFSHSDQQLQWQSSVSDQDLLTGWGGRIADLLGPGASSSDAVSMCISLNGINRFLTGNDVVQYTVSTGGAIPLDSYGTNYSNAWTGSNYTTTTQGKRLKAFEDIMRYTHENLLEESYVDVVRRARSNEGKIGAALTAAASSGVNFDTIFGTDANAFTLSNQMKMIAKLIAGRNAIGNTRQIFFCGVSGYDTHAGQMEAHANLMTELGTSLKSFRDAMVQLGVFDNVLTVTHSDFARTFTPNGMDDGAGADHAWGGHQVVLGGAVNGGRVYGQFPNLQLNVGRDVDDDHGRGRWIPTTSVDQYLAASARWIGVDSSNLAAIFPNLHRFDNPFGTSANLAYVTL